MLRFIDGEGNECEQLRTVMSWGESLILPNVPDTGAPDMWKLEKNEKLGDAITLKGGDILTLKKGESWNLFLEKGILNFYMPKKCTVSLYNNSGTSVFSNGILPFDLKKMGFSDLICPFECKSISGKFRCSSKGISVCNIIIKSNQSVRRKIISPAEYLTSGSLVKRPIKITLFI